MIPKAHPTAIVAGIKNVLVSGSSGPWSMMARNDSTATTTFTEHILKKARNLVVSGDEVLCFRVKVDRTESRKRYFRSFRGVHHPLATCRDPFGSLSDGTTIKHRLNQCRRQSRDPSLAARGTWLRWKPTLEGVIRVCRLQAYPGHSRTSKRCFDMWLSGDLPRRRIAPRNSRKRILWMAASMIFATKLAAIAILT